MPSSSPLRRARRSCSAPLSASLLNQLGVEARAGGLDYRPSSLGVTLHAVNIRQSTAARPFLNAERVEVDFSPAILRGTLVLRRLDVTKPEVVLDSTTQGASAVPAADARGRLTHDPPQPFPHSTSTAGGCAISRSRLSVQTARTSLFAGSRCRSPAKGQESCGERLSCRVGGPSGAERRRLASIGHGRTCHSPERRWPSRRSRWTSPVAAIGGTAHLDVSRGDLEVKYDARVALGELQKWSTEVPPLEGELEASGTVGGTLDHPVGSFDGRVKRLHWQEVTDASVSAAGRWSGYGSDDRSVQRLEPRARCESERERASRCR